MELLFQCRHDLERKRHTHWVAEPKPSMGKAAHRKSQGSCSEEAEYGQCFGQRKECWQKPTTDTHQTCEPRQAGSVGPAHEPHELVFIDEPPAA